MTMEHKMYDYSIAAAGVKVDERIICTALERLGLENILVESLLNFEATVEKFPDEEVPGLADACVNWMDSLFTDIGEIAEEKGLNGHKGYRSENPRILAKAMHKQLCSSGRTAFQSANLVCEYISDVLNKLRGDK